MERRRCTLIQSKNIYYKIRAKAALKFGSEAWVLKKRDEKTFRSSTDEIFETLTWNNKIR
jgi:hypothetical protein